MCIIALKQKGIAEMKWERVKNMFNYNNDGAGFAIWKNGQREVTIQKGYMTYKAFERALKKAMGKTPLQDIALMLHFRITTHGGTSQQNCHPFVVNTVSEQQKLYHKTNLAVCMNGTVQVHLPYNAKHSDTMEYIGEHMTIHRLLSPKFYSIEQYLDQLYYSTGAKWAFLDNKGNCYWTDGLHVGDDGWVYSNDSYEYTTTSAYGAWWNYSENDWYEYYQKEYGIDYREVGKKYNTSSGRVNENAIKTTTKQDFVKDDDVEVEGLTDEELDIVKNAIPFIGAVLTPDGVYEEIYGSDNMYLDIYERLFCVKDGEIIYKKYDELFNQSGMSTTYYDSILY